MIEITTKWLSTKEALPIEAGNYLGIFNMTIGSVKFRQGKWWGYSPITNSVVERDVLYWAKMPEELNQIVYEDLYNFVKENFDGEID